MMIKFSDWEGCELSQERIDDMARQAVHTLQCSDDFMTYVWSGDTLVTAFREDNVVQVLVSTVHRYGFEYEPESDPDILHI